MKRMNLRTTLRAVPLILIGTLATVSAFAQPPQGGYGPAYGMGHPGMMGGYGPGYGQFPGYGMGHPGMMGGSGPGYDQRPGYGQDPGFNPTR